MKPLILLALLLTTGCQTTRQSVEVRVEAAEDADVKCVAVYRVEVR